MPVYTYRREDGTQFSIKQSFSEAPLTVDPESGQKVVRIVQPTGVIFKGSGFYINDSKGASKQSLTSTKSDSKNDTGDSKPAEATSTETKPKSSGTESAAD
ncbi:MAG: zinc ribbon domain-containing protein [Anaerolineae bacterium]